MKKKQQESDEKALKQKRGEKEYVNRKSTIVLYIKEKAFLLKNLYMVQESIKLCIQRKNNPDYICCKTFTWPKNQKYLIYEKDSYPKKSFRGGILLHILIWRIKLYMYSIKHAWKCMPTSLLWVYRKPRIYFTNQYFYFGQNTIIYDKIVM